ncbi:hypothetical protein Acid345_2924 [Candidatus Koribacter versatilis Ellin345]|uniref:Flagella basal body P-ring formation protein FlgA SAF domain-containing protein n=1 Tax=Koribacter versatilis (strain Ellin345) TaxID=204669 RepID=Q1IMH5_KORVE|nr:flagella basal body P-ring formation protein FlgA [Candidatus Koribacter versatilis]ABF41925.1 hypothetical protein Acid345_2924 [Candidatus Koribacter versatilis Ellin345]
MGPLKVFLFCVIAILSSRLGLATTANDGLYEIPKSRVCAAIQVGNADCHDVELLSTPLSRESEPILNWNIERNSGGAGVLRIECANFACVPFLVVFRGHPRPQNIGNPSRSLTHQPRPAPVVHAGNRLTLIRQGNGVRLTTTVVSLSAGRVGESIHVREYRSSRSINSVVVDAHTVTADY